MNDKDEVVIKIKEAYLRLDEIKDKFNEEKKKLENELSQLMGFEKSISRWLEDKYDRVIYDLKKDNGDSEEELNRLKQIFNTYSEANKNQFVFRRKAIENNVEDLYVHYRETVRVQEMQIEDLQNKFRKLNAEEQ
jgi:repeat organellar protein